MAGAIAGLLRAYPTPETLAAARERVLASYGPAAAGRGLEAAFAGLIADRSADRSAGLLHPKPDPSAPGGKP
jgi:hypothetical protein